MTSHPRKRWPTLLSGVVLSVLAGIPEADAEVEGAAKIANCSDQEKVRQHQRSSPFQLLFDGLLADGRVFISPNGKTAVFQDSHRDILLMERGRKPRQLSDHDGAEVMTVTDFGGVYIRGRSDWKPGEKDQNDVDRLDTQTGRLSVQQTLRYPLATQSWMDWLRGGAVVDSTGRYVTAWGPSCCDCNSHWRIVVLDDCNVAARHRPAGSKPDDATCARDILPSFGARPFGPDAAMGRTIQVDEDVTHISHAILVGDRLLSVESVGEKTSLVTRNLVDENVISRIPLPKMDDAHYIIAGGAAVAIGARSGVTIVNPTRTDSASKIDIWGSGEECKDCGIQSRVAGKYVVVRARYALWVIDAEAGRVIWQSENPNFIDAAVSASEIFVITRNGLRRVANLKSLHSGEKR